MNNGIQLTHNDKTFGMLAHLSALAGFVIPFGNIIGPLLVWLIKKEGGGWIDRQGRESLNFQITVFIFVIISGILTAVFIGYLLLALAAAFSFVMVIIASVKVYDGQDFRYPFCIRFLN